MPFSLSEVLEWTGGRLANAGALGSRAGGIRVEKPAQIAGSGSSDLVFFFSREYQKDLPSAAPGIMVTGEAFVKSMEAAGLPLWQSSAVVACADPYLAMALMSAKFAAVMSTVAHVPAVAGRGKTAIHASAVVHPEALIADGASIGAHAVIERGASIGGGTVVYPGCFVGPGAVIGRDCVLFPNVTVYEWTRVGDRVRLHAGVVLGADGFGYAPRRDDGSVTGHQKIFHLGRVEIGDDVEIGASSCVDRGTFGETRIGAGAKLDNHVHVGHNATVEEGAILCGGICLAGRAHVGRFVYVGGMTGISNDVHVGDGANIGACSLITKDVPPGGAAVGNPQRDYRDHFKAHAMLSRLTENRHK